MEISTSHEGSMHIIAVNGDLDASSSIVLDRAIAEAVSASKHNIVIDCNQLNYISSAGLGVFMSYLQDFQDKNISLLLFGLNEKVMNVFEILGLDQLLTIVPSKEEARMLVNDPLL
ncbi:STAS domain-containing protein [Rhodocytophaga aerolata]|uniref:Anti-sigma factor antagonist n=1 Tax=Rhodocytophaga aerolata TaxID=455078 RepID=A0ABT8R900_9BACT|nr:STAS domain-containing protein [Rhodocytophaga aerolata]MDO1448563.1 STAS domain-containing protein [Rhodocytophaga aerolata]